MDLFFSALASYLHWEVTLYLCKQSWDRLKFEFWIFMFHHPDIDLTFFDMFVHLLKKSWTCALTLSTGCGDPSPQSSGVHYFWLQDFKYWLFEFRFWAKSSTSLSSSNGQAQPWAQAIDDSDFTFPPWLPPNQPPSKIVVCYTILNISKLIAPGLQCFMNTSLALSCTVLSFLLDAQRNERTNLMFECKESDRKTNVLLTLLEFP